MATAIRSPAPSTRPATTSGRLPKLGRLAVVLEIFLGIGALFGGIQFILAPDGHLLGVPLRMLAGTPFHSFLVPGLLLFTFVGVGPMVAAAITARRGAIGPLAALAVGLTLMGWITVEMVIFAGLTSLFWAFYLVLGTAIAAVGLAWKAARYGAGARSV
ncbi:MAG TPA: hypothetical protein VII89_02810 [Candidatus Dormibacteraeota bacterium]